MEGKGTAAVVDKDAAAAPPDAEAPGAPPADATDAPQPEAVKPVLADAAALKARLATAVQLVVGGALYRVRPVSMLLFVQDPTAMWQAARKDKALLDRMIKDAMANPSMDQLRRVLVSGMVHPRVVAAESQETPGSIWVDTLLTDYTLATELYLGIARQSI